ncbi:MAG: GNAT family N-acetyltransferase [Saprospiraceae bacterium]|nr:GNAT family N-acetyltransferase [Saprospiraceae bacterium]
MDIKYLTASDDYDLRQILTLQQSNLRLTKSPEIEAEQGFVTVKHEYSLLKDMNDEAPHILAKDGDKVVGYALGMTRKFKDKVAVLRPMFELLDGLLFDGKRLGDLDYIVMGQICIDEAYRGKGIFRGLYDLYFQIYKPIFGFVVTEVAARNTRSLKAHLNVGFKEIYRYDETGFEEWIVIIY